MANIERKISLRVYFKRENIVYFKAKTEVNSVAINKGFNAEIDNISHLKSGLIHTLSAGEVAN